MADRDYRILVATDRAGIDALAGGEWKVLESTVKTFRSLDTEDDLSFGNIGRAAVQTPGVVALAYKE